MNKRLSYLSFKKIKEKFNLCLIFLMAIYSLCGESFAQSSTLNKTNLIKNTSSPQNATKVIQGQVFVVTRGQSNIKLALVNVLAYPLPMFEKMLSKIAVSELGEREAIISLMNLDNHPNELVRKLHNATRSRDIAYQAYRLNEKSPDASLFLEKSNNANQLWEDIKKEVGLDVQTIVNGNVGLKNQLASMKTYNHFYEKLSPPAAQVKSDADGFFELSLPSGPYALVAKSNRLTPGGEERYLWMVKIDAGKLNQKVYLSNDNMVETFCEDCVRLPNMEP